MPEPQLTPTERLALALWALFAVLFRADAAAAVARVRDAIRLGAPPVPLAPPSAEPVVEEPPKPAPPTTAAPPPSTPAAAPATPAAAPATPAAPPVSAPAAPVAAAASPSTPAPGIAEPPRGTERQGAAQLLATLQREGRLLDFIEEDLAGFPDASIGAAARIVHSGCKRAIEELFRLEPIYREAEGSRVTVAPGFDRAAVRLTGEVAGAPPYQGSLRHHGWRVLEVKLPPASGGTEPGVLAPAEVEV